MFRKLSTTLVLAAGLAAAVVAAPLASAQSAPARVTIPVWLTKIQFPGTSSQPTVYMAGSIVIPEALARLQYPGASSLPTVYVAAPQITRIDQVPWLARTSYPGTSSRPTVYVRPSPATGAGGFDWVSALVGAGAAVGLAVAGAGGVTAVRNRRALAHE